jgi:UDPglucose 6-dehydrogenase
MGSGFVGQATGKSLSKLGHDVIFCDTDERKLRNLESEGFKTCREKNLEEISPDIIFLTVPTPTKNGQVDLKFIHSAAKSVASKIIKRANNIPLVVVKSTVPPGTTEHSIIPILETYSQKKSGQDFETAMNPEYLRERFAVKDFENPRLILIGSNTKRAREMLCKLYDPYAKKCQIVSVTPKEAEMQKYVHNLWNATKISFFNEIRALSEKTGINPDAIFRLTIKSAEASWNPEYGIRNFGPYGGSCLPKDTVAFLHWSKNHAQTDLPLLRSVIKVNENLRKELAQPKISSAQPAIGDKMHEIRNN